MEARLNGQYLELQLAGRSGVLMTFRNLLWWVIEHDSKGKKDEPTIRELPNAQKEEIKNE